MRRASPVRRAGSLCRDLSSIMKVSYFYVRDHMKNESARLAGISLYEGEISLKRADDFSM